MIEREGGVVRIRHVESLAYFVRRGKKGKREERVEVTDSDSVENLHLRSGEAKATSATTTLYHAVRKEKSRHGARLRKGRSREGLLPLRKKRSAPVRRLGDRAVLLFYSAGITARPRKRVLSISRKKREKRKGGALTAKERRRC